MSGDKKETAICLLEVLLQGGDLHTVSNTPKGTTTRDRFFNIAACVINHLANDAGMDPLTFHEELRGWVQATIEMGVITHSRVN